MRDGAKVARTLQIRSGRSERLFDCIKAPRAATPQTVSKSQSLYRDYVRHGPTYAEEWNRSELRSRASELRWRNGGSLGAR